MCETGGARRSWLRGLANASNRYLMTVAAHNLGLMMRKLFGVGTPKGLSAPSAFAQFLLIISQTVRMLLEARRDQRRPRKNAGIGRQKTELFTVLLGSLISDAQGNLYGTAIGAGKYYGGGGGTVFELSNTGFGDDETSSLLLAACGLLAFAVPCIKRVCWAK